MIVSFAVVHHLPGTKSQQEFFDEVYRVLKPGGTAIISAWDIWKTRKNIIWRQYFQNKFRKKGWELGDTIMNFTHHQSTRFVHGFSKNRLLRLAKKSGFEVESIQNIHRASKKGSEENIVLVLRK
jgi:SAM-dependent methyltransferase